MRVSGELLVSTEVEVRPQIACLTLLTISLTSTHLNGVKSTLALSDEDAAVTAFPQRCRFPSTENQQKKLVVIH